ncbi:MAG TPA: hypothetical protein VMJ10_11400 [Kofleriaceae bacterium]|nr:hypothetical protein [Kofleriaceae bacterium]
MVGRRAIPSLLLALALTLVVRAAHADNEHLVAARHAIELLDYDNARAELDKALATGSNGPDELGEIYLLTGIVTSSLGDGASAVKAFEKLLALSPKAKLVAGTSPKIRKRFAAAAAYFKDHSPLAVTTETSSAPPSIALVIQSDPLGMVAGARVVVSSTGAPDQTLSGSGSGRIAIALPPGRRLELRVYAVDDAGNRLVELGGAPSPIVVEAAKPAPAASVAVAHVGPAPKSQPKPRATSAQRPLYEAWWLWGACALASSAGATYFGFAARSEGTTLQQLEANSTHYNFGQAEDVLATARRDALLANIGFGVAAGLAVVTGLFYIKGRGRDDARSIAVAPAVLPGGGALAVEGSF